MGRQPPDAANPALSEAPPGQIGQTDMTGLIGRPARWIETLQEADLEAVRILSRTARSRAGRLCAIGISKLGNGWIYILLAVVVFAHWGLSGYKVILCAGVNAGVTHSLYPLIKRRYRRRRPFKVDPELSSLLATLDEHSFPSGHAMTLAAVLTPIVMLWPAAAIPAVVDVPRTGLVPDRDRPSLSERRPRGRVAGNRAGLSDLPGVHFHLVRRRRGRLSAPNASWVSVPH